MRLLVILLTLTLPSMMMAEPAANRTCRIIFLKAPADAPTRLQLFDGVQSQEVELPRMNFSPVVQISAATNTIFMLDRAITDAKLLPVGSPQVAIGQLVKDFYLLVSPDPKNQIIPIRLQVVDASPQKFAKGHMMWFNLSENLVSGKIGSQVLKMAPGTKKLLDPPSNQLGEYGVLLNFQMKGEEKLYPLTQTRWRHDPESRAVIFIIKEPGSRTPRVMGFPDSRVPAK